MKMMKPLAELGGVVWLAVMAGSPFACWSWFDRRVGDPEVRLSIAEFAAAYAENEVAADARYKGLAAVVDGRVERVGKIRGVMAIDIADGAVGPVRCVIGSHQKELVARLRTATPVSVVGKVAGAHDRVPELRRCRLELRADEQLPVNSSLLR